MNDHNAIQLIKDKIQQLSKYWHKRTLTNWGVTDDMRTQYHVQIQYWGTHNAYLIFKEKVSKQEAEKVITPLVAKISDANQAHQSSNLNIDVDPVVRILDIERTQQANA